MKRMIFATAGAALTMAAGVASAAPAQAAPLVTGGLVNVTITDVLNDNTVLLDLDLLNNNNVAIPVALDAAVQVCGATVGVIARDLASDGTCTNAINGDTFTIEQR